MVLPVLFSPNPLYRRSVQLALQYCKFPFGYSLPAHLGELRKEVVPKEVISKDQIRMETAQLYANLSLRYHGKKGVPQSFIAPCVEFIMVCFK